MSISHDGWSDKRAASISAVAGYHICWRECKLVTTTLGLIPITDKASLPLANQFRHLIFSTIPSGTKLSAITTDNASAEALAGGLISQESRRVSCFSHSIQLVLQNGFFNDPEVVMKLSLPLALARYCSKKEGYGFFEGR